MKKFISTLLFTFILFSLSAHEIDFSKYDYVNVLDSTFVKVTEIGSGTFNIVKIIKIQTNKGALQNRVIKFDYDPLTAFAKFTSVKILRANGKVEEINVNNVKDYVAPAHMIYWGARQILLEVGRLYPGDKLKYEIEKKGFTYALLTAQQMNMPVGKTSSMAVKQNSDDDRFAPPMRGEFYDIVPFWTNIPICKKVYILSIPENKEIQFKFYQGNCASSMVYKGDRKVYEFTKVNMAPFKRESNMVDYFDCAPKLFLSSTKNWKEKSKWFNKVNEDYGSFNSYAPAAKKVKELINGKTTEMGKIEVLTHWVADNIRYSGITMGEGEGFTLHPLSMNYEDRCGVCKDIAGSLIGMLRIAGVEAYPAMTMAGSRVEKIPADHFNHCVVVARLKTGELIPIDPTWVPFCRELWSSAEQQQNYLPGVPEGSDLCETPLSPPENHYFRIKAINHLDASGNLKGEFIVTAEGQSDRSVRGIFLSGWRNDWQNYLEGILLTVSPKAKLISVDYGKDPKNYMAAPISIKFKYVIPDYAVCGDNEVLYKPIIMNNLYNSVRSFRTLDTSLENRKYGFKDRCSRLVELEELVYIPRNYKVVSKDINIDFVSTPADFQGTMISTDNTIKLNEKLVMKKRVYNKEDWNGVRQAILDYDSFGDYIIIKKDK
ncbi:MAG: DUF3857 and transglutaminase domain-containing protein [Bacteroidales bacterium]